MIQQAIANLPQAESGPTSEEINAQIQAALSNVQPGMTPEQVQAAVLQAVAAAVATLPTPASAVSPTTAVTPAAPVPATATPAAAPSTAAPADTPAATPVPATAPRDADLVWSYDTGREQHSSPVVTEEWEVLYIGTNVLDSVTGEFLWGSDWTDQWFWPAVSGKTVYWAGLSSFYAKESGKTRWRQNCYYCYKPAVSDATVFVGVSGSTRGLTAIDAETGEPKWKFRTDGPVTTKPAISDSTVYFGSEDNRIYALSVKRGELTWSYATNDSVQSSPAVVDGVVYFGSNDNHLYAVDAATGAFIWRIARAGMSSHPCRG